MTNPGDVLVRKTTNLFNHPCKVSFSSKLTSSFRHATLHPNPFWVQLSYLAILSLLGFVALKNLDFKTPSLVRPKDIDLLFTSISAVTSSSMSTIDIELFSNSQLIVLMFLMFMGGDIFMSMIGLLFQKFKHRFRFNHGFANDSSLPNNKSFDQDYLRYKAIRSLGYVVLCYILVVHSIGFILAYMYITYTPSSRHILINKGISVTTFSLFTTISTFSNCGFVPTNENMMLFKKNSGLLLILIPQILVGSILYPVVLWGLIFVLEKVTKRAELGYMLKYSREMGYVQLLPMVQTFYLAVTVSGLCLVQFVVFCCVEWRNMELMGGLSGYEKLVASFFQVVNTRYAGEAVFDLSKISPALLVGFLVMM